MISLRQHLCLLLTVVTLSIGHQVCAAPDASPGAAAKPAPKAVALSGRVLETMDGGGYTYLLLKNGAEKVWVAIPLTKVTVGQELNLLPGYEFKNFTSKALNRKFDRVIFSGGIDGKDIKLSPSALKMVHQGVPDNGQQPAAGAPKAAPPAAPAPSAAAPAAAAKSKKPVPVVIDRVRKAKGPNAYNISELYAKRIKLEKKPVVVRGKVVQVATRILKRNWVHLKDGTGTEAKKNNFIVVTTQDLPKEGDIVTARGTLYNRIDLGSGYKYELLIQDAKLK